MPRFLKVFLAVCTVALGLPGAAMAQIDFETPATHAVVMDFATGKVLYEKNAYEPTPPASMAKMMTAHLAFQAIEDGRISLDDEFTVSVNAWKKGGAATGGSTMFLEPNTKVKVSDLLRGIIVQSGNDASIVMAEGLAGSEELFAQAMTEEGERIGMKDSVFTTATGLPDPNQHVTVYDLAVLARDTIMKYPQYYELYSELNFTYNGIKQGNRNPLLYKNIGVDGLKTGHTEAAGYGLTASAVRNGRRLIVAFNGTTSMNERSSVGAALLGYGFLNFDNYHLFDAGETIGEVNVWLGTKAKIPMVVKDDVTLVLKRLERANMQVTALYDEPVPAPIRKGDQIGTVHIDLQDEDDIDLPILAGEDVEGLGPLQKVGAALQYLIFGASAPASPSPAGDTAE